MRASTKATSPTRPTVEIADRKSTRTDTVSTGRITMVVEGTITARAATVAVTRTEVVAIIEILPMDRGADSVVVVIEGIGEVVDEVVVEVEGNRNTAVWMTLATASRVMMDQKLSTRFFC